MNWPSREHYNYYLVTFITVKNMVFWDVRSCIFVDRYQRAISIFRVEECLVDDNVKVKLILQKLIFTNPVDFNRLYS
jgi:hypothetical protein